MTMGERHLCFQMMYTYVRYKDTPGVLGIDYTWRLVTYECT